MTRQTKNGYDPVELLQQMTVDAEGDDKQLRALAATIAGELKMPADAFVVGEDVHTHAVGEPI